MVTTTEKPPVFVESSPLKEDFYTIGLLEAIDQVSFPLTDPHLRSFTTSFVRDIINYSGQPAPVNWKTEAESGVYLRGSLAKRIISPHNNYSLVKRAGLNRLHPNVHPEDLDLRVGNTPAMTIEAFNNIIQQAKTSFGHLIVLKVIHDSLPANRPQWLITATAQDTNEQLLIDLAQFPCTEVEYFADNKLSSTSTRFDQLHPLALANIDNLPSLLIEADIPKLLQEPDSTLTSHQNLSTLAELYNNALIWNIPFQQPQVGYSPTISTSAVSDFIRHTATSVDLDLSGWANYAEETGLLDRLKLGAELQQRKLSHSKFFQGIQTPPPLIQKYNSQDLYLACSHLMSLPPSGITILHHALIKHDILPASSGPAAVSQLLSPVNSVIVS